MAARISKRSAMGTAKKLGFRSGLEEKVADQLKKSGVEFEYETTKIKYVVPQKTHTYTPDFVFPNGLIVETKGYWDAADRKKHLLIKQQHPDLDIRFVFTNSNNKIRKGYKTSYADFCNKNGFLYADKEIPKEWLE